MSIVLLANAGCCLMKHWVKLVVLAAGATAFSTASIVPSRADRFDEIAGSTRGNLPLEIEPHRLPTCREVLGQAEAFVGMPIPSRSLLS